MTSSARSRWFVSGLLFVALIPGLSLVRGEIVLPDPLGDRLQRPVRALEHGRRLGGAPRLGDRQPDGDVRHRALRRHQLAGACDPAAARGHLPASTGGDLNGDGGARFGDRDHQHHCLRRRNGLLVVIVGQTASRTGSGGPGSASRRGSCGTSAARKAPTCRGDPSLPRSARRGRPAPWVRRAGGGDRRPGRLGHRPDRCPAHRRAFRIRAERRPRSSRSMPS